jgi:hypothetical protein
MKRVFAALVLNLLLPLAGRADDLTPGHWQVTVLSATGTLQQTSWIINVATTDGKTTATLVSADPRFKAPSLVSFKANGKQVHAVFKFQAGQYTFAGAVVGKDGKRVAGVYGPEGSISAAVMTPTDLKELTAKDVYRTMGIKELDRALTLGNRGAVLRNQARTNKDPDERAKLLDQAREADKLAAVEVPKLYRETIDKHPDTYAAGRAALLLLQNPKAAATDAELRQWSDLATKSAGEYGPALEIDTAVQAATAILARKEHAPLAVAAARRAEALLQPELAPSVQVSVLETLVRALKDAGKTAELSPIAARLTKLEAALDNEYLAKVPPFKPAAFAGRKSGSDRVAVMELFTGAQCPPCVAADVAFDALQKTYKPSELVLIQYHLHIPGPDPLTNADTVARARYYGANSTPTTLFNGRAAASGGGPMAFAESKFKSYCDVIDPLLETPAVCQLSASAKRNGDKIMIEATVKGMADPGPDKKLRLVLVEESIRYVGSNKLRFHHQVVRAMPGGVDGVALTKKKISSTNEVDLAALRKGLNGYLDDYAATVRPFPRPNRPMDFHGLRVIAFVQDDATREILQAVQVAVNE